MRTLIVLVPLNFNNCIIFSRAPIAGACNTQMIKAVPSEICL